MGVEGHICIWDEKKSLWIDQMLLDIDEGLCEHTWVCYLYNILYAIVIILSVEVRVGVCSGLDVRHDLIRQPLGQSCCNSRGVLKLQRGAGSPAFVAKKQQCSRLSSVSPPSSLVDVPTRTSSLSLSPPTWNSFPSHPKPHPNFDDWL